MQPKLAVHFLLLLLLMEIGADERKLRTKQNKESPNEDEDSDDSNFYEDNMKDRKTETFSYDENDVRYTVMKIVPPPDLSQNNEKDAENLVDDSEQNTYSDDTTLLLQKVYAELDNVANILDDDENLPKSEESIEQNSETPPEPPRELTAEEKQGSIITHFVM